MSVTFAGSPDRVEAQLVPEAGYELDTFRVTGFPRRPSLALLKALILAGRAPFACRRILARRRPDVVLGGGGFVAGPMVLAAATKRIPAALTEADAHLGLANRLALPFAKSVLLAYPLPGRSDDEVPRRRPADPAALTGDGERRSPAALRAAGERPGAARLRSARGRALAERARGRDIRRVRPAGAAPLRGTRLRLGAGTGQARRLQAVAVHRSLRRRALGRRPRRGAQRRHRLGAGGSGEARDPRSVSSRHRRPPGEERRALPAVGRRRAGARDGARDRPRARPLAARRPGAPAAGWARRCCRRRGRALPTTWPRS